MARMTLDELVSQLRAAYGAALRSVVLYGSAAAGEHDPKRSDYNVLVIVDALDATRLAAASAASRAWADAGNPAPLTLTTSEWRGSADIFPMEYADILERTSRAARRAAVRRHSRRSEGSAPAARAGSDGEADQAAPGRARVRQRRQAAARAARREREHDHDHLPRVSAHARRDAADRQRVAVGSVATNAPDSTRRRSRGRPARSRRSAARDVRTSAPFSPATCGEWSSWWRISISIKRYAVVVSASSGQPMPSRQPWNWLSHRFVVFCVTTPH